MISARDRFWIWLARKLRERGLLHSPSLSVIGACNCRGCCPEVETFRPTFGDGSRFWAMAAGLALIVISWLSAGCVHAPSAADPARCTVGASTSHSRGAAFGEPTEDVTVTVWSQCDL